ncbi:CatB-related O-acetyltransferase [Roseivirga sp. E12]|uniref:CatB-related O-acetyltransferase n=1 Tax=Roseivirga sp. E12 TaxID=2819237 RepID=UPI001ABC8C76|nr:CatB-related O-acetyltransferase [Roseivirga sp. E12]MBO3698376.1 CatB-related O-acetyltransferase [Roseivirga sp. E12]
MLDIVLFGANQDGKHVLASLKPFVWMNQARIVAFLDNDSRITNTLLDGVPVYAPESVSDMTYDKIIVCPIFNEEITNQLVELGVPRGKIEYNFTEPFFGKSTRTLGRSSIGKYSYVKPTTVLQNAEVGSFCHVGDNCVIGQMGHRTDTVSTYPLNYHFTNKHKDITKDDTAKAELIETKTIIKNDVYIGEGAIIKVGVTVGHGAVIASRAYVTKDVPDYAIVGGIPAKVLKLRFSENEIKRLLEIEWWDWPEEKIGDYVQRINGDIGKFLSMDFS